MAFPPNATGARIEFRIGDECASLVNGEVENGATDHPDAVVSGDASGFYDLVVDRDLGAVTIGGSEQAVSNVLATLPPVPLAAIS
jgi:hypothetical protein